MDLTDFDLGEFMQDVGRAGVTMMIKVDSERLESRGKHWTVLLSGLELGGGTIVRWDFGTLEECVRAVIDKLHELHSDWEWLDFYR